MTEFAAKLAAIGDYRGLAAFLAKFFGQNAVAVQDAIGLWHISPEEKVAARLGGYYRSGRKARIAFRVARGRGRTRLRKEYAAYEPLIALKLHTLDLSERLKRFELLARSEDKLSKRQLQVAKQKAREEFEKKLNLFGKVSHDLKTPFSTLISNLEDMVLSDETIPVKLRLNLETIRGMIYRTLKDAGQSLDAARLFTRRKTSTLIPYNLSAFIAEIVEVYAIVFESYGLNLTTEIDPGIPAEIDPIQMEKVLNNLLNNAIKHNIPGGMAHVSVKSVRGKTEIRIADNGLGIGAEGEKVKDLNPWRFSSHGYGLEIVRELVRANRGRLAFKSEGGIGTTVTVTLPALPALKEFVHELRRHNFQTTLQEVELLAAERTQLSRRRRHED